MTMQTVPARPLVLLAVAALAFGGCARQVTRIAPEQAIDLSGGWNDVDSRMVAEALIQQSFASNWVAEHMRSHGGDVPAVVVGAVRNRSMEHIAVNTFVNDLERAYVNSGAVQIVSSGEEREELRDERQDQQDFASAPTRSALGMELGAAYMLQGEIQSIEDREGRRRVVFYQVDLSLVELESNNRVWVGQHKIKKYVENPRVRI
ncbi:MAG: penicillin-binding protein activator LpoB [Gemmatimonas sp.]|nr:penicillin-binding protein activator LpoB [Gemmatimonas sp.]